MSFIIAHCTLLTLFYGVIAKVSHPISLFLPSRLGWEVVRPFFLMIRRPLSSPPFPYPAFYRAVLAGKLCVRDAQMSNTVCVPTPHPHHTFIILPDRGMLYLMFGDYLNLYHYNVIHNCTLHTPYAVLWSHR